MATLYDQLIALAQKVLDQNNIARVSDFEVLIGITSQAAFYHDRVVYLGARVTLEEWKHDPTSKLAADAAWAAINAIWDADKASSQAAEPELTDDERAVLETFRSRPYSSASRRVHDFCRVIGCADEEHAHAVGQALCGLGLLGCEVVPRSSVFKLTPTGMDYLRDHEPEPASAGP